MTTRILHFACSLQVALLGPWLLAGCAGAGDEDGGDESSEGPGGIYVEEGSSSEGGEGDGWGGEEVPIMCDLSVFTCPHVLVRPVMLVLDNSYSMRAPRVGLWDDDRDDLDDDGWIDGAPGQEATPRVTRWRSLHRAVEMMSVLSEQRLDLAATLFPAAASATDVCAMGSGPEIPFGTDWAAALLAEDIPYSIETTPGGASPTAAGIEAAMAGIEARGGELPGAMVLVTDGPANCGDESDGHDERLAEVVAAARERGVSTYVVGVDIAAGVVSPPGRGMPDGVEEVDVRAALSELAVLGGTAQPGEAAFFDAVDEASLTDSLRTITEQATSCVLEFEVPIPEDVYEVASMRVETVDAVREYGAALTGDCAGESGWRFTDAGRQRIELCGEACSVMQANGSVSFAVGCAQP
jgi:hypothetical protein